jgi:hypothetical protein
MQRAAQAARAAHTITLTSRRQYSMRIQRDECVQGTQALSTVKQ